MILTAGHTQLGMRCPILNLGGRSLRELSSNPKLPVVEFLNVNILDDLHDIYLMMAFCILRPAYDAALFVYGAWAYVRFH